MIKGTYVTMLRQMHFQDHDLPSGDDAAHHFLQDYMPIPDGYVSDSEGHGHYVEGLTSERQIPGVALKEAYPRRRRPVLPPPNLFLAPEHHLPNKVQADNFDITLYAYRFQGQIRGARGQIKKTLCLEKTHLPYGKLPPCHISS